MVSNEEEIMSLEKVKSYFKQFSMEDKIMELKESSATVQLAALALGCEEARIAKTLSFMVEDKPILIVVAGDVKVSNSKYKQTFGVKAKMLNFDDVEALIGHKVGGVCPFAVNEGVIVYLDESLKRFKTVYPACGSGNSAIELTIEELEKYSNYIKWVDISQPINLT